jgi:DNA primase
VSSIINENIVDEIKSRCNIVDVIGRVVSLKKTGSKDKQIFTCFGCGATGDVIEFVKRQNNLEFREAAERLAEECGISLQDQKNGDEVQKNHLYELNRDVAIYYYNAFCTPGNKGAAYMKARGIDPVTLKKFGIGFADEEWDSLYRCFEAKKTPAEQLIELGLVSKPKDKYYDKFRNRVMFPIINTRNKVIGFGGRALGDDNPKYLNSQESSVFLKKYNLYGLNIARQEITKSDYAIIVEGYMDVLALYNAGIRNAVASLGTALTTYQATMIKRYTSNIILAYDADEAGIAASLRGMDILRDAGCSVKILRIADGKDPDDFVKKHGKEAFYKLVRDAQPLIDYKIDLIRKKSILSTTEGKISFIKEITPILKAINSPVEAEAYIRKIASETKISEGALQLEIFGGKKNNNGEKKPEKTLGTKTSSVNEFLEKNLIKLMLSNGDYTRKIITKGITFSMNGCDRIFDQIKAMYKEDEEIDIRKLEDALSEADILLLKDILENIAFEGMEDKVFSDCMQKIKQEALQIRQAEILNILSMADEEIENSTIQALTHELIEIQNKTRERI